MHVIASSGLFKKIDGRNFGHNDIYLIQNGHYYVLETTDWVNTSQQTINVKKDVLKKQVTKTQY